jgi:hypothetical protein
MHWKAKWHSHCTTRGIENGSESQTRHDWQRRPAITSATTDLEIVDVSRTMSRLLIGRGRVVPQSPAAKKLGLRHRWEARLGPLFLFVLVSGLLTSNIQATAKRRLESTTPPWAVHFLVSHTRWKSECMQVSCGLCLGRQKRKKKKKASRKVQSLWAALG